MSVPCLFLEKHKLNLKNKILIICKDIPKYPKNIMNGPISNEINFEINQIKKVINCIDKNLKDKIFIRPYLTQPGYGNQIKNIKKL